MIREALYAAGGRPVTPEQGLFPMEFHDQVLYAYFRCTKAVELTPGRAPETRRLQDTLAAACNELRTVTGLTGSDVPRDFAERLSEPALHARVQALAARWARALDAAIGPVEAAIVADREARK